MNTILAAAEALLPHMSADRRQLHRHPELGFQEFETARYIVDRLREIGITEIREGIAETGVLAMITGTAPGPGRTVLLRADMDALPIDELNEVDYRSQNPGRMHACGHDGHVAMLLAIGHLLYERRDRFSGHVKLCFQPSEEAYGGGARPMIEAGVLDDPNVDAVFGQHAASQVAAGIVGVRGGPLQASTDELRLTVRGTGGHGAMPNLSVDTVLVACEIVSALQSIASRNTDPLHAVVVTIGAIHGGTAGNIIPETIELKGTVRTMDAVDRDLVEQRVHEIAQGVAATYGATVEIHYHRGYPPTVNDPAMADLARRAAVTAIGEERVREAGQLMAAEDFSYFLEARPGAYVFLGTRNDERGIVWPHHHPRFDMDESAFPYGVATLVQTTLDFLSGNEGAQA